MVFDDSVRQIYVSVAQIICNQPSNWHLVLGQKATIRFLKIYMDWWDIWRLIFHTISCKYPEILENISPLLSGFEQTYCIKWLFLIGQYSLGTINLMMTLTRILWSAGLQLKLCHKDTSVSYYSASATASCSQVLFMTECLKIYVQNYLYQLSYLKT